MQEGLTLKNLLNKCVEQMLAHSQKQVKDLLLEAKDHQVIHERLDEHGTTFIYMNYTTEILEKIVNDEILS